MNYKKIEIYNHLKFINQLIESHRNKIIENGSSFYPNGTNGIAQFLEKEEFIRINKMSNNQYIPFLTAKGNDFLKRNNRITCFIQDYEWSINIILGIIIAAIIAIGAYLITI